jgi:RNA polymerase sigma-70 factor, ECF subfamily
VEGSVDGFSSIRFFTNPAIIEMDEHCPTPPEGDKFSDRVRFVRAGDKEALGEVLDTCRTYLLVVANRGLPEDVRAKIGPSDLVQETFLQAQQIFDRFQGESQEELRAWLVAILENKVAQVKRHYLGTAMRDVGREVPLAADSSLVARTVDPGAEPPSAIYAAIEEAQKFDAAMKRMPADFQTAIEWRSLEWKSFAELGLALDRSADAARKLWLRAFERLQIELGLSGDSDDPLIENDESQGART